jgi:2,4-dienoyl-CoA reductase-like NADH-dependent reductase (Old Yellow Enzyme family)
MGQRFAHLLSPGRIGSLELKNRIVHAPMSLGLGAGDGTCGDRFLAYYARRAKGGAGLINIGTVSVGYPEGSVDAKQIAASDDRYLPSLTDLAEKVHAHGAKIVLQLNHNGPQAGGDRAAGRPLAVPSIPEVKRGDLADCFLPEELAALAAGNPVLGEIKYNVLDEAGIARIVAMFAAAADRAKRAGIDAVEIHGGHGYLLAAFLSPVTNHRADRYGGPVENRSRFLVEVIQAVRASVGPDFPVWCKIDSEEFALDGGIRVEDAIVTAQLAEAAGADAISVSAYSDVSKAITHSGSHTPQQPELLVPNATRIKAAVGVPVITAGRIEIAAADRHIAEGHFDFVAFGRKLLADPDLPRKLLEGQAEAVRPCIYCYSCISQAYFRRPILCTVNPEMGREVEAIAQTSPTPPPYLPHQGGGTRILSLPLDGGGLGGGVRAVSAKRVVVIGGGPVGMVAALRLAERGHETILFEKSPYLGGAFRAAGIVHGPNQDYLDWLEREIAASPVDVRLGVEATPENLADLHPDLVIVATGGALGHLPLPAEWGTDIENFLEDLPAADETAAGSFVIFGSAMAALELAQWLNDRGTQVSIVDDAPKPGAGLPIVRRARMLAELRQAGVEIHAAASRFEVRDGQRMIFATEPVADRTTADRLEAAGFTVLTAGDCAGPLYLEHNIRTVWDMVDGI